MDLERISNDTYRHKETGTILLHHGFYRMSLDEGAAWFAHDPDYPGIDGEGETPEEAFNQLANQINNLAKPSES